MTNYRYKDFLERGNLKTIAEAHWKLTAIDIQGVCKVCGQNDSYLGPSRAFTCL